MSYLFAIIGGLVGIAGVFGGVFLARLSGTSNSSRSDNAETSSGSSSSKESAEQLKRAVGGLDQSITSFEQANQEVSAIIQKMRDIIQLHSSGTNDSSNSEKIDGGSNS
jgi:hypothetical protein